MTLQEIEPLLDSGRLCGEMSNGMFWRIRRNGKTKTWKTRPGAFSIPVKAGWNACAYLRHDNTHWVRTVDELDNAGIPHT